MSQAQPPQSHQQGPVIQQVPLQTVGIEERLQCLANGVDSLTTSGLLQPSPAPLQLNLHEVKMYSEPTHFSTRYV